MEDPKEKTEMEEKKKEKENRGSIYSVPEGSSPPERPPFLTSTSLPEFSGLDSVSQPKVQRRKSKFEQSLETDRGTKAISVSIPHDGLTLEEVWMDRQLRDLLKRFASSKYAEENVLFLEEVLTMKENNEEGKVKSIFEEYIEPSSPMEINITSPVKKQILEKVRSGDGQRDVSLFDEAIDELAKLIRQSLLKEFLGDLLKQTISMHPMPESGKKRVVIVGGGFLGLTTARLLDPMTRFEIILIDSKDYFEYTPAMIHAIIKPTEAPNWQVDYKSVLQNGQLIVGSAQAITKDFVMTGNHKIPYNYLVVCTGSSYTSQFKGNNISTSYRLKKLLLEHQQLEKLEHILVIGGGVVGVEISTMIAFNYPNKKVTLLEANSSLIKRTPAKARRIALEECKNLGINVILNERASDFHTLDGTFETSSGRKISFDKVYIATGPVPNTDFLETNLKWTLDSKKQIRVHPTMQVDGFENIFAGGDCSNFPVEKLAFNSAIHGVLIAKNICRVEKGKSPVTHGMKGIPKERRVQYSQLINVGPNKVISIFRDSFATTSTFLADFKMTFGRQTMDMLVGRRPFMNGVFGKLPNPLMLEAKS